MSSGLLLGVEIGGTKLQFALGHGDGRILARQRLVVRPEAAAAGILDQIRVAVEPLTATIGARPEQLDAAGIGFGGPVDAQRGIVIKSHQIAGWDRFPLADWFRREVGIAHVALQNDADTAGLGEAHHGAGQGLSPILYVTVGSGIGGGLILDGRIYRDSGQGAVEIGHLWVRDNRRGRLELLENVASGWAMGAAGRELVQARLGKGETEALEELVQGQADRVTGALVAEAAQRGDRGATRILETAQSALAEALAHAVTLFAPRRIILGGGVCRLGEGLWLAPIRRQVENLAFPPYRGTFELVAAALGEEVVLHGALDLAYDLARASGTLQGV